MAVTAAKPSRCCQGRGGTRKTTLPWILQLSLFWICRNVRAECKSETILQDNDSFRVLRVRANFLVLSQLVDWEDSLFCVGLKSSKLTPNERHNIYKWCPLKAAFTIPAKAFLYSILRNHHVEISIYFRMQANKVVAENTRNWFDSQI